MTRPLNRLIIILNIESSHISMTCQKKIYFILLKFTLMKYLTAMIIKVKLFLLGTKFKKINSFSYNDKKSTIIMLIKNTSLNFTIFNR